MRLKEALAIKPGEVISLVGGGGKTTIMFALARELALDDGCVITTTTTKILEPTPSETPLLILETGAERMMNLLYQNLNKYRHVTLATEKLSTGKLKGVRPELIVGLDKSKLASYIIVEADGAAHKSLKAPNATEPVIPQNTSLLIPVVGIDALGCKLTERDVFRPEIVSKLTGVSLGGDISAEAIAILITHPKGITKGSPVHARIIPFINKMDLDEGLAKGRDLASKILGMRHRQIRQVILGQAQLSEPVLEVISGGVG